MNIGLPDCWVDIYPYEGGQYSIAGYTGLLLQCSTSKSIWDFSSGVFTLTLAPGGPFGPNASPGWQDIITPMSLVVIAMRRSGRAHIVMIGVALSIHEEEEWPLNAGGGSVQRAIRVGGRDFAYFFTMQNYYAQLLQFTQGAVVGIDTASVQALGLGSQNQTIDQAGSLFFNNLMAGTKGLMANTNFAYEGSRVSFPDIMASLFAPYPNNTVKIPVAQNFMIMNGTWAETFQNLFPFPVYEFFVTTAENGAYGQSAASTPINSSAPGIPSANPAVIARPMPIPRLTGDGSSMDFSAWDGLPFFTLDVPKGINTEIDFTEDEVRNFYIVNPLYIGTLVGVSNNDITPAVYTWGAWLDAASIERYGYRPNIFLPRWWVDPTGAAAQANGGNQSSFQQVVADVALRVVSYYEPTPLMAHVTLATNLRPDIIIGAQFEAPPYKDLVPWTFYIHGIEHTFNFGGPSATTLRLCRGLPSTVYDDQGLMTAIHTGSAMRQDGSYTEGLPPGAGQPLQKITTYQQAFSMLSQLSKIYQTPGAK